MRVFKIVMAGCAALSLNTSVIGTAIVGTTLVAGTTAAQAEGPAAPVARGGHGGGNRGGFHGGGRGGGFHGGRGGGRGWGRGAGAAAVGLGVLGILGAAAAANAERPPAVYEDDCPLVRRRVYLDDGSYVVRRVPAC